MPTCYACVPTHPHRRSSVPPVPEIDDGSGTTPAPGPPNPHKPGPAPSHAAVSSHRVALAKKFPAEPVRKKNLRAGHVRTGIFSGQNRHGQQYFLPGPVRIIFLSVHCSQTPAPLISIPWHCPQDTSDCRWAPPGSRGSARSPHGAGNRVSNRISVLCIERYPFL